MSSASIMVTRLAVYMSSGIRNPAMNSEVSTHPDLSAQGSSGTADLRV